jgi:hypothetical protein
VHPRSGLAVHELYVHMDRPLALLPRQDELLRPLCEVFLLLLLSGVTRWRRTVDATSYPSADYPSAGFASKELVPMIPILTAAVIVLAILVALNLLVTFAMIRRLKASEMAAQDDANSFRPTVGSTIGEFEVTAMDGSAFTHHDLADGPSTVVFLLPNCGGCGRLIRELAPEAYAERSVVVAVAGVAGDPQAVAMIQSIPSDLRVVLAPLGGSMNQAFHVATFPTVVHLYDGKVTEVADELAVHEITVGAAV